MTDPTPEVRVDTAEESKNIPAALASDHENEPRAGSFTPRGLTVCVACLSDLRREEAIVAPGGWVCGAECFQVAKARERDTLAAGQTYVEAVAADDVRTLAQSVARAAAARGVDDELANAVNHAGDYLDAQDAAALSQFDKIVEESNPDPLGRAGADILAQTARPAGTAGFPQDDAAVVRAASTAGLAQGLAPMPPEDEPLRLEIGGGLRTPEGWICVDRSADPPMEAWPLPYADGTVDAINASHVLEHFPHRLVATVLADWIRALRPGGLLRVSVPDMTKVATLIAAGQPCIAPDGREVSWAHILAGGQKDLNDYHLCHMDAADLMTLMARGGLIGVGEFASDRPDCSQYAISANVQGRKPSAEMLERATSDRVSGCRTIPRLGWNRTAERMVDTALKSGVEFTSTTGAYVDLGFERAIQQAMKAGRDFILVTDYDTVWAPETVQMLVMLMDVHPEFDAMMAMQLRRGTQEILASAKEEQTQDSFAREVVQVRTGHFGCTIFRREVFETMELPWFRHQDSEEDGVRKTVEADMNFWNRFEEAGLKFGAATHVPVGHTEEFIVWPDQQLRPIYQPDLEYDDKGPPPGVRT